MLTQQSLGLDPAAVKELRSSLRGALLEPGDDGYEEARHLWNAMNDRHPALIARCAGAADVIKAVNFGRDHKLLLSVKGGGHGVAGNAVADGSLTIDLSPMKGIRVDPQARTARAEGGVTWGEFDRETQSFGLATTGGTVSTTGIAGLTLGAGFGMLMRRYGLACDNLISADIVTADGQLLRASASEHPDLFWAVRGGGGNFGVVTSFEYQLHPVGPTVLAGMIMYPISAARDVMRCYREVAQHAPDEFGSFLGLLTSPDGQPLLAIVICHSGPAEQGHAVLQALRNCAPPVADTVGPTLYVDAQRLFDPAFPTGHRNYWKSSFLPAMSDEAIETVLEQFERIPSPLSAIGFEHFGGAVSRVGPDETAFGQRDMPFNLLIVSQWIDPADDDANIAWTRDCWAAMRPYESAAAYVNYLSGDEQERVSAAYGVNYAKLQAVKRTYDPSNLFRMNQNIRP